MKYLFFSLTVLISSGISAQTITPSVAISYNFLLLDDPSLNDYQYVYEPGKSAAFTRLYYPEMKKFTGAFLFYAEQMRSVKNYIGPLGTGTPTSLGDLDFKTAINKNKAGELEKIGNLYFDPAAFDAKVVVTDKVIEDTRNHIRIEDDELSFQPDTIITEDLRTGDMKPTVVQVKEDVYKVMSGAGFIEEWTFDKAKGNFEKDIRYMSVSMAVFDRMNGDYRGQKPLFAFKCGNFNKRNIGEYRLVRENMEYNVLFNRDFNLAAQDAQSDGMVLTSDAAGYIEPSVRYQFLIAIMEAVYSGQLAVYEYNPLKFDIDKAKKLTRDEFFARTISHDTVYTEDLFSGEMNRVVIEHACELNEVIGIRFIEDWYMDYENMTMYKRVKGIILLKESVDPDTGLPRGAKPVNNVFIRMNPKL